jgi:T5SS/PEP-CTERM-associated repeat protein
MVTAGELLTSPEINGDSEIVVSGAGTWLQIQGNADIGQSGTGLLEIRDGAHVDVGGELVLSRYVVYDIDPWSEYDRYGELRMKGASSLDIGGDFMIGYLGYAGAAVDDGSTISAGGDLLMQTWPLEPTDMPGLHVTVGPAHEGQEAPIVDIAGVVRKVTTFPDPIVRVRLADDYVPAVGDSFKLLEASDGVIMIQLDLNDAPLPVSLRWHVTKTSTELSMQIMPLVMGDITLDGVVDSDDLFALLGSWGECPDGEPCPADLTDDGMVDTDDLFVLLGAWTG